MIEFAPCPVAVGPGTLALSPMPGRTRHYATDFAALLRWGPDLVVTMCEAAELARKGAGGLPEDLAASGIAWVHLPIADFGAPGPQEEAAWPELSARARGRLARGGRVLVHCHGGCGRSGMAVLRLMIEAGEAPAVALDRLRRAWPCAVETAAQLDWAMAGTGVPRPRVGARGS